MLLALAATTATTGATRRSGGGYAGGKQEVDWITVHILQNFSGIRKRARASGLPTTGTTTAGAGRVGWRMNHWTIPKDPWILCVAYLNVNPFLPHLPLHRASYEWAKQEILAFASIEERSVDLADIRW